VSVLSLQMKTIDGENDERVTLQKTASWQMIKIILCRMSWHEYVDTVWSVYIVIWSVIFLQSGILFGKNNKLYTKDIRLLNVYKNIENR